MKRVLLLFAAVLSLSLGLTAAAAEPGQSADLTANTAVKTQASSVKNGLMKDTKGYYYYFVDDKKQTGWKTVNGAKYYFNKSSSKLPEGAAYTGLHKIGGKRYYFNKNTARMISGTWKKVSGSKYYFTSSGAAQTGWKTISGSKYYFGDSGKMRTGWQTISGKRYYFGKNGKMRTGWKKISGYYYYFNKKGVLQTDGVVGSKSAGYGLVNSKGQRSQTLSSKTKTNKMISKAQSESSSTGWLILVNSKTNRVGVFSGSQGNWTLRYYWTCCTGASSTPTVKGRFTVQSRGYSFDGSNYTCYYWTQFYGNYLFHSVLYYKNNPNKILSGVLGQNVSHGCVRLKKENAKWIYDNIPSGTKVYSYSS